MACATRNSGVVNLLRISAEPDAPLVPGSGILEIPEREVGVSQLEHRPHVLGIAVDCSQQLVAVMLGHGQSLLRGRYPAVSTPSPGPVRCAPRPMSVVAQPQAVRQLGACDASAVRCSGNTLLAGLFRAFADLPIAVVAVGPDLPDQDEFDPARKFSS